MHLEFQEIYYLTEYRWQLISVDLMVADCNIKPLFIYQPETYRTMFSTMSGDFGLQWVFRYVLGYLPRGCHIDHS